MLSAPPQKFKFYEKENLTLGGQTYIDIVRLFFISYVKDKHTHKVGKTLMKSFKFNLSSRNNT
jgi:hypothetical protein